MTFKNAHQVITLAPTWQLTSVSQVDYHTICVPDTPVSIRLIPLSSLLFLQNANIWWALGSLRWQPGPSAGSELLLELSHKLDDCTSSELAMSLWGIARLDIPLPKLLLDRWVVCPVLSSPSKVQVFSFLFTLVTYCHCCCHSLGYRNSFRGIA